MKNKLKEVLALKPSALLACLKLRQLYMQPGQSTNDFVTEMWRLANITDIKDEDKKKQQILTRLMGRHLDERLRSRVIEREPKTLEDGLTYA